MPPSLGSYIAANVRNDSRMSRGLAVHTGRNLSRNVRRAEGAALA